MNASVPLKRLTPTRRLALVALRDLSTCPGSPVTVSMQGLHTMTTLSPRTLVWAVQDLEALGHISVRRTHHSSNTYVVADHDVWSL